MRLIFKEAHAHYLPSIADYHTKTPDPIEMIECLVQESLRYPTVVNRVPNQQSEVRIFTGVCYSKSTAYAKNW